MRGRKRRALRRSNWQLNLEANREQKRLGGVVGARGEQRKRAMAVGICDVPSRADSDHNPRKDVTKDFLPSDKGERPR
jgi:hypothetical protein